MGGQAISAGLAAGALALGLGAAFADSAPLPNPFSRFSTADAVVLAVKSEFAPAGGHVRVAIYEGEANFLETAQSKHDAVIGDDGLALLTISDLTPGEYAFVAYYDRNGDGKLNRSVIGKPKEPYVFSNGVRPKLRKPTFAETKVAIAPGEVVVLTLKN